MITRVVLHLLLWSALSAQAAVLFPTNSSWFFLRGTNEASFPDTLAWTRVTNSVNPNFEPATAPFHYGDGITGGGTSLDDMQGRYSCFFLRRLFQVTNAAQAGGLRLSYLFSGGVVVWINGHEVVRDNVADGPLTTNTLATAPLPAPAIYTNRPITPASSVILNGSNTIAVQVFNDNLASPQIIFDALLEIFEAETVPPAVASVDPPPGTVNELTEITVRFSEPVVGVTADDLLIDTQPASSVTGSGDTYTFSFAQPPYGGVAIAWSDEHGIVDLAVPPNGFNSADPGAVWSYDLIDTQPPTVVNLFPAPGASVRTLGQIEVTFSEEVAGVEASDLLVNDVPATNVVRAPGGPYVFQFAPLTTAGSANLRWAPGHGIVDQAVPPNAFGGGNWTYTISPSGVTGDIIINEFVASNESGLADEDGEAQDWIELYNRGPTTVNLVGWSLSDDEETPGLWVFPSVNLASHQYLVVFASGKDRKAPLPGRRFHTNFKLGADEYLALFNSDSPRVLISGFTPKYPEQRNDSSYGYDNAGIPRYFAVPTPGGPNGVSTISGVTAPVHFSTTRGHYTQPFSLKLTCATPGAEIRYTTNGAEPTLINGQMYLGPLTMAGTTILRAAAFRTNLLSSTIATHSYFFNQNPAVRSLPVISIATAVSNLYGRSGILGMGGGTRASDGLFITNNPATDYHNPSAHGIAWERPVSAEWIRPEDNSGFQIDCGIRVQGSDWQRPRTVSNSKFSFRLYFRGDYGSGRLNYRPFPDTTLQAFDQMVLRAGFNEAGNPFIRDEMIRRLYSDMGNVGSVGTLVHVFTNGFFAGYYNPCERVAEQFAQAHHGGSNQWDIVGPDFALSSEGLGVIDGDRNDFNSLHNYIAGQTATSITNPAVYNEINRRLDLQNFVDYCLLNVYGAMGDWPANNWRAGKDRGPGGIWRFYVWDAEWGLGFGGRGYTRDTFAETGPGPTDGGLASTSNSEIARIYQSLRRNREFRLLWADRIYKHFFNNGALTELAVTNRLIQLRTEMTAVFQPNGGMIMTELGPFLANRRTNIFNHFQTYGLFGYSNSLYGVFASSNAPVFNRHGGPVAPGFQVNASAPLGGVIYFTTDGSDPRVRISGAIAPSASVYSTPLPLLNSTLVKARTLLNGTNWSALAEATFVVGDLGVPLRLTEIMYNPVGGTPFEFLELQNIGATPLDLGGMLFSEGITFTFNAGTLLGPGARLVLANNADPLAFAGRYPGVTVAGYYAGNLNNGGERLTLRDQAGRIVFSVNYGDSHGWPTVADGAGYSLELTDPLADPNDPSNWHASGAPGGSPGATGITPTLGAVRLNEILATNALAVPNGPTHPDFVELYNDSASPVSMGGWSLSDDGTPGKFIFPGPTEVPAGGYLVVWCDSATNTTPGLHAGFELDAEGEAVFLFDASSNRVDGVSFGRQAGDYSLGRVDGSWQLTVPTPNAANALAEVGSPTNLVINEWMANPLTGQSDWVELYNTSATLPVPLYGVFLATSNSVHRMSALAFLRPGGFIQLLADEGTGPDHLSFHLPATGSSITLSDPAAQLIQRVTYGIQLGGISQGRLPDGSPTVVSFPGTPSPGAPNYTGTYAGAIFSEILARNVTAVTNAGRVPDFVELFNPGATPFSLSGMGLSVGKSEPGQWVFPPVASIPANGYLVIWCDGGRPVSFTAGDYNTGRSLDGDSGGAYLFNVSGQLVNVVEYGPQVADLSIGLTSGQWRLLAAPTPGAPNAGPAMLGSAASLRLNEWMASPARGADWLELFNPGAAPVDLAGLGLSDDLSTTGTNKFLIPPLSFIGAGGFVRYTADSDAGQGRDHLSFSLDAQGEGLRLYAINGTTIYDTVVFGAQLTDVSEGRWPDGSSNVVRFPGSPTPGAANYLLVPGVGINEVLTHAQPPLEDAVELRNTSGSAVDVSGWFLSNSQDNLKKFRIPNGTTLPANGFLVLYEYQFNSGPSAFSLNAAHGTEVWLAAADAGGNLTGYRATATVGPALNAISFGPVQTSMGVDFAPLAARTFGQDGPVSLAQFRAGTGLPNAGPLVGPVIVSEIFYHPPAGPGADDEYLELQNTGGTTVNLFDPAAPTNTWKISGGVTYSFPSGAALTPGAFALVVGFDPADSAAATAFRSRNGVSAGVPIFGPFQGKLDNAGDTVALLRPDAPQPLGEPDAGFVPYMTVDKVDYRDELPWPTGAVDGGGFSLQRRSPTLYGNEPLSWAGAARTPGAANSPGPIPPPVVTAQPVAQSTLEGSAPQLSVTAVGEPLTYQWRLNRIPLRDQTNSSFGLSFAVSEDSGLYDVVVSNPGGSVVSDVALLKVAVPPQVLVGPASVALRPGQALSLSVLARGDAPLNYQWRRNGVPLPGETAPSLTRSNVQLPDEGIWDVVISNASGSTTASATLLILINPSIVQGPVGQSVVVGGAVTLSGSFTGNPLPLTVEWRKIAPAPVWTNAVQVNGYQDFFTFIATNIPQTNTYRLVVRNLANQTGVGSSIISVVTLADSDHDGVPDAWVAQFGPGAADRNGDPDGDGLRNWQEYLAGTDPTDATSNLRVEVATGPGSATVQLNAISNRTYSVQYSDRANGPWRNLTDVLARATNHLEIIPDPGFTTNRFYRAVTPQKE